MADTILTREGYNKIEAELDYLRNVKRVEVSERLHSAIEGGGDDLLENAELEAARNEQAFVEGRIDDLAYLLSNAKVVDEPVRSGEVGVGSTVIIHEDGEDEPETYMIVGAPEVNLMENKISNESPLGQALVGARVGDTVQVMAPAGTFAYRILSIQKA